MNGLAIRWVWPATLRSGPNWLSWLTFLKAPKLCFVGGDSRYGFGRLEQAFRAEARCVFGKPFEGQGEEPAVKSEALFAYAEAGAVELKGDRDVRGLKRGLRSRCGLGPRPALDGVWRGEPAMGAGFLPELRIP